MFYTKNTPFIMPSTPLHSLLAVILISCVPHALANDATMPTIPWSSCASAAHGLSGTQNNPIPIINQGNDDIRVSGMGDMVFGKTPPEQGESSYFDGVRSILQDSDYRFGNIEGAITDYEITPKKVGSWRVFAFRFPPSTAALLKQEGINAVTVANNHSSDYGVRGFADTEKYLSQHHIGITGTKGQISYSTVRGQRIALIGFSYFEKHNWLYDTEALHALIATAKTQANIVIVTFHGGAEGPTALWVSGQDEIFLGEKRGNVSAFAKAAIDAGAHAVIGHGPHVVRAVECYKNAPIFYSLGNFIGTGGLSSRKMTSLAIIGEIIFGPDAVFKDTNKTLLKPVNYSAKAFRAVPLRFNEHKIPQVDPQGLAIHVMNDLARKQAKQGQFMSLSGFEATAEPYRQWLKDEGIGEF